MGEGFCAVDEMNMGHEMRLSEMVYGDVQFINWREVRQGKNGGFSLLKGHKLALLRQGFHLKQALFKRIF